MITLPTSALRSFLAPSFLVRVALTAALPFVVPSSSAFASGLDTPPGVNNLPFNIEGNQVMTLSPNGLSIGLGSAPPQATLDVGGTMRATELTSISGSSCAPHGAIAYDMTHDSPVYCGSTGKWTTIGTSGGFVSDWVVLPCPDATSALINLASYVPTGATGVELVIELAAGEGGGGSSASVDGYVFCRGGLGNACSSSVIVSNATHTIATGSTGEGYGTCNLHIAGYF